MNTKYSFDRRLVLTISVLFTALWLPLTAFAQVLPQSGDLIQSANTRSTDCQRLQDNPAAVAESNSRVREERVGFSETDPTDQQSRDIAAIPQAFNNQVQQIYVGFSEADPADQKSLNAVVVLQPTNHWVQQVSTGFTETDPAVDIYQSIGETFANCLRGNAKDMVLETPEVPSQIEKGYRLERC